MRYYVIAIQHNKDVNAENRSVPKAFDDLLTAKQEFHAQLGRDINNSTLDWGIVCILNSYGYLEVTEKWMRPMPEPEIETEEREADA